MEDNLVLKKHPRGLNYLLMVIASSFISFLSVTAQKREIKRVMRELKAKDGEDIKELMVPSRDAGRSIRVQVYEKKGGVSEGKKGKAVHVNFHGSGFVIPSLGTDSEFCAHIATTIPHVVVFDCDYRKAPSIPFPGYHHDGLDVLSYIFSHPETYDVDKITLSGFSAGANLAMGLAIATGPEKIKALISFYGNPDVTKVYDEPSKSYEAGLILPSSIRRFFYACTFLEGQSRSDPRISPSFAPSSSFPNHVFMTCGEADALYEPERLLVERLKKDGKNASFEGCANMAHAWDKSTKKGSKAESKKWEMYKLAQECIEEAHREGL